MPLRLPLSLGMMLIGLVSDSHGVFSQEFRDFLAPVDQLWHAGDFGGGVETAREFAAFKPLVGVLGNCDTRDLLPEYPVYRFFEVEGMSVLMIHIGGWPGHYDLKARALIERYRPQIFVCGHSHILRVMYDTHYRMLTLNPGACGIQGWHQLRTALRFKIENGEISDMEVFKLPRESFRK